MGRDQWRNFGSEPRSESLVEQAVPGVEANLAVEALLAVAVEANLAVAVVATVAGEVVAVVAWEEVPAAVVGGEWEVPERVRVGPQRPVGAGREGGEQEPQVLEARLFFLQPVRK